MEDTDKLATGKAIILEIVRAMRTNLEPLLFTTVAPSRFFVYLHPADHQRLEGIIPVIIGQARRALDEEVRAWNERAKPSRIPRKWIGGDDPPPPIDAPPDSWDIRFEADADGEMAPGDIAIASELTLPAQPEFEGSRTRRITTMRQGDRTSTREQTVQGGAVQAPAGTVYGTLTYEDQQGRKRVPITSTQLVVGRGGVGYWVDVKLDTSPDVSREHCRLRRDETSGQFFLKDLSSLGTTVDGAPVPSSVEVVDGRKRDKGIEVPLPPRARIGLANVIVVDFEAGSPRHDA
jgi:pSer/pThr/pTyr-binding forkhead associated (FHA) protein